jgi:hypothetical protein
VNLIEKKNMDQKNQVHYKIYCIANKLIQNILDKDYTDNSRQLYEIHNSIHVSIYKSFDYRKFVKDI